MGAHIYPIEDAPMSFVPDIPPPIERDHPLRLTVNMEAMVKEVALDSTHNYEIWGFNGGAPGPIIRARVGDILDINLRNDDPSGMQHNLDFHSVCGPGGGAQILTAHRDETVSASFKMLNPGFFVYHCAVDPVAHHIANGMYGAMIVEPENGFPPVDKEYVIIQSEFYTQNEPDKGTNTYSFNEDSLLNENPNFVVFNGRVGSHTEPDNYLKANTGDRVRIFFANVGPNLSSSFHVIGGIFDKVYREGDVISPPARNIQTTMVPAGGVSIVELVCPTPGILTFVDHSISRVDKGAAGFLKISGPSCPEIYFSEHEPRPCKPCKIHP